MKKESHRTDVAIHHGKMLLKQSWRAIIQTFVWSFAFGTPFGLVTGIKGTTIEAKTISFADVHAAVESAKDGDTVTVPAGKASWNSVLTITKGITLTGATTVSNAGTSNPTANDLTVIQDDSPLNTRSSGLIKASLLPTQSFRLTGFTFTYGARTTMNNVSAVGLTSINLTSTSPVTNLRMDHCHFLQLYCAAVSIGGWTYGVADHNLIECRGRAYSFSFNNGAAYGGSVQGHGAWADYPWLGTSKFFFIEDNTIVGGGAASASGAVDGSNGARFVVRHNSFTNAHVGWHGTEGPQRGTRAVQVYDNAFHWPSTNPSAMNRSGVPIYHDNTWDGRASPSQIHSEIAVFREFGSVALNMPFRMADGSSPWEVNDTEGNGTYVEGHPPHAFDSGTATAATTQVGPTQTLVDSSKNWTPNQWVGYSVKQTNPASTCYPKGSYIVSNTSNTIYYYGSPAATRLPLLLFNVGDTYQIHRILTAIDQVGRGKGDLVSGSTDPLNRARGTKIWPHEALEPAYSWNNVYTPTSTAYGFHSSMPTEVQNRDYYNLGKGFPKDTIPDQVKSTYVASLNGVDYIGEYVYPHPLVRGSSASGSSKGAKEGRGLTGE